MKILLIAPSTGHWHGLSRKKLFNGKTFRFSMLSLLSVAAATPKEHSIKLIDEQIDPIPEDEHFDLVGVTVMTSTAPRSYQICQMFKDKSIPVVLGGFHPTFNLDEAGRHADAVVAGPAAGAWQQVLNDVQNGGLKKVYHGDPAIEPPAAFPKHLLNKSAYLSVNTTYATLGCTNQCSFCSITAFYKGNRYKRKVEDVYNELAGFKEKFFMFIDDNLTQDREHILELLERISPLKKKWITQVSVEVADDPALLQAMQKAGCVGVFIGLESFSESALCSQNKNIKSPQFYKDAVKIIHSYGIYVEAGLIFGFDTDSVDIFETTLKHLDRIGIDAIQASILTPLPGTKLFIEMKNRIVDFNWEHYDYGQAVFNPALMTQEDLNAGLNWIKKKYYAPWRIFRRLARWLWMPSGYKHFYFPLVLNVAYWGRQFQFRIKGYNPADSYEESDINSQTAPNESIAY